MATLNISNGLIKGLLFYLAGNTKDLLRVKQQNNDDIVVKRDKSLKYQKAWKFYDELDKELTESIREIKQGKVGHFQIPKDLFKSLGI